MSYKMNSFKNGMKNLVLWPFSLLLLTMVSYSSGMAQTSDKTSIDTIYTFSIKCDTIIVSQTKADSLPNGTLTSKPEMSVIRVEPSNIKVTAGKIIGTYYSTINVHESPDMKKYYVAIKSTPTTNGKANNDTIIIYKNIIFDASKEPEHHH